MDLSRNDVEITKYVSLLRSAPLALAKLKEGRFCILELPEALFDADYPGHYMRRIKMVTLTITPYGGDSCALTLLCSKTRISSEDAGTYLQDMRTENSRVVTNLMSTESMATRSLKNELGIIELKVGDEPCVPFEGNGAVSLWRIELPQDFRASDYAGITDVILHLCYTARHGGPALRGASLKGLKSFLGADCSAPDSCFAPCEPTLGTRTCVAYQAVRDEKVVHSAMNRRGSKDSQLR